MHTARRCDPAKDARFHVSIATTEEVRRIWAESPPQEDHAPARVDGAQGDCSATAHRRPTCKRARREHRSREGNANPVGRCDYRTVPRS